MKIRCPHCKAWVSVILPLDYEGYTATVSCPQCGHGVTVDIKVKSGRVGPKEHK